MTTIHAHRCGTAAVTIIGHIDCTISAVVIRFDRIQYELTYLNNGEFKTVWMNECEFIVRNNEKKIAIGFK